MLLLAPVYVLAARGHAGEGGRAPLVPWFVAEFAVAVAVRSTGVLPMQVVDATQTVATVLLAADMFGLGIRAREMWPYHDGRSSSPQPRHSSPQGRRWPS